MKDIQNQGTNPITAPVGFFRNLFTHRQNPLCVSQVDDDVSTVDALADTVYNLSLASDKVRIDRILFRILHLLDDHLFGGLRGNSSEGRRIHFCADAVPGLTFRIQFQTFLQGDLQLRFCDLVNHLFELKHLDLTGPVIILNFDIDLVAILFPGSGFEGFLQSLDEDFPVNSSVPADLVDDTFNICYKHGYSPLKLISRAF